MSKVYETKLLSDLMNDNELCDCIQKLADRIGRPYNEVYDMITLANMFREEVVDDYFSSRKS